MEMRNPGVDHILVRKQTVTEMRSPGVDHSLVVGTLTKYHLTLSYKKYLAVFPFLLSIVEPIRR